MISQKNGIIFVLGTTISKAREEFETKESQMVHKEYEKENKSERRMPRLLKARKDVVSCEKLRGSANRN